MRVHGKVQKKSFSLKRYGQAARERAIQARREMEREFGRSSGQCVPASDFVELTRRALDGSDTVDGRSAASDARGLQSPNMMGEPIRGGRGSPDSSLHGSSSPGDAAVAARVLLQHIQQANSLCKERLGGGRVVYPHAVAAQLLSVSRHAQDISVECEEVKTASD
ncbi:AP2 domain transcription factor AP2IX-9 [Besnoitia besnoiti]|uniref:AP2 domain transcription factor AP2IX-9 n=1 Tax=Besnoitia besnoiti TaxID=94643 RepID=A0A2A9M5S4_BESBE|nr:AP2 domain transcription factor AP2IX-9 [Besnoitia besnoiti]PFH32544.1 AP2 domain transcription factor AP2IX-9 [Besnoitia besnoiti]